MYSENTALGGARTKLITKKIGDFPFVNGRLSPDLLEQQLSLDTINRVTQRN